jgi:hypothetical protein
METIKSIIFDWGGVLVEDPEPGLMQYCAQALAVSREDYIKAHSKFIVDFEKNFISEDTFWERICSELKVLTPKVASLWAEAFKAVYRPKDDMFAMAAWLQEKGYKTPFCPIQKRLQWNIFINCDTICSTCLSSPAQRARENPTGKSTN